MVIGFTRKTGNATRPADTRDFVADTKDAPYRLLAIIETVLGKSMRHAAGRSRDDKVTERLWEEAVASLGRSADIAAELVASSGEALALIEAEGDRIDRLIAENQERLEDLLAGKW